MKPYLSQGDVGKLLEAADNLRAYLIIKTLWSTGMRVSELIGIKTTDVDPSSNTISIVHLKASGAERHRLVPVHHSLANELLDYVSKAKIKDGERIFPINRQTVSARLMVTAEKAGFGGKVLTNPESMRKHNVSPHKLRDALAVHWLKKKNTIEGMKALQGVLGHANYNTTARYFKLNIDDVRRVYNEVLGED